MAYDITQSTDYGGKSAPTWVNDGFYLPGYHNAFLSVTQKSTGKEVLALSFKVSPSTFSDARSKLYQLVKTFGGWMIQKLGNQPIEVNLGGYMFDMKGTLERHDFIDNYKKYIEDQKNYTTDYYNEYYTKLVIEGREYYGMITALTFSKQASNSPFLYQYNLSFIALGEKRIYNADYATQDALILEKQAMNAATAKNTYVSPLIGDALNISDISSTAVPVKKYSKVDSEEGPIFEYTNIKNNQTLSATENTTKAEITLIENNALDSDTYIYELSNDQKQSSFSDEVGGALKIAVSFPQDIITDSYNISWNLHQIEIHDLYERYEDNIWTDGPNRNQYLNTIIKCSNDLKKKTNLYAETYYTSPHSNESNIAAHSIKSFVNSSLDKIISGCNNELIHKNMEPASSDYLIKNMENIAQSIYTFVTQK